mmetsp:Transcript_67710/g.180270  ORF Transcript_67710/g.180270 Transcript_67710/m.180270 type:complete len:92 (-) Transcript_67710:1052-1327(-)
MVRVCLGSFPALEHSGKWRARRWWSSVTCRQELSVLGLAVPPVLLAPIFGEEATDDAGEDIGDIPGLALGERLTPRKASTGSKHPSTRSRW